MNDQDCLTNELSEETLDEAAAMAAGILIAEGQINGHNEPVPLPSLLGNENGQTNEENAEWTLWGLLDWF